MINPTMSKQIRISDRLYDYLKSKNVVMAKYLDNMVFSKDSDYPKPVTRRFSKNNPPPSTVLYAYILDNWSSSYSTNEPKTRAEIIDHVSNLISSNLWSDLYSDWYKNHNDYRSQFQTTIDNRLLGYLRKGILTRKDDEYYLSVDLKSTTINQIKAIVSLEGNTKIKLPNISFD